MAGNQRHRRQLGGGGRRQVLEEDTDDSGIETMSVAPSIRHEQNHLKLTAENFDPLLAGKRRPIRMDDVLWIVCFLLTVLLFDIPNTLLFNQKVNWFYLCCALANQLIFCCLAVYFRALYHLHKGWALSHASFIRAAMAFCSFFTAISFCLATWTVYEVWSMYISLVSGMTFLACIAIL